MEGLALRNLSNRLVLHLQSAKVLNPASVFYAWKIRRSVKPLLLMKKGFLF
ncbi:Hypothetical Protein U712_06125 [Bacillus subtilis PY79]|nr:Hypothetical Protein U712_06125 [Bacillus subtilis PY79]